MCMYMYMHTCHTYTYMHTYMYMRMYAPTQIPHARWSSIGKRAGRGSDPRRPGPRVISDCHFRSTAQPLYTRFPVIFSSCFSKVTVGSIPTPDGPWRASRRADAAEQSRRHVPPTLHSCSSDRLRGTGEKGVRSAQTVQVGLCIPVGIQR
jgi:hypothetical protein